MPKRDLPPSPAHNSNANGDNKKEEGVAEPGENDVISGRGDTINRHPGNVQFRKMIEEKRRVYLSSHFKREKRLIAESIVASIKAMDPPGRFLSKDTSTGLWFSIGEDRAREKASQALRENSKKIREEIQEKDMTRQREKQQQQQRYNGGHSYNAGENPGHYDPHHYPYAHPSSAGWGYPYYYGYGAAAHQAYPPAAYPPHTYPPYQPDMSHGQGPTSSASSYAGAYPDAVPYGSSSHEGDGRSNCKQDQMRRVESDEHMDSSGSSDGHPQQLEEPQEEDEELPHRQEVRSEDHEPEDSRPSLKCRRIEPLHAQTGGQRTDHDSHCKQPYSYVPPPTMPSLERTEQRTPPRPSPVRSQPLKSPRPAPIVPPNHHHHHHYHHERTPDAMLHKLANESPPHSYNVRSPLRGGPFGYQNLTPAGANCVAALDEILASPKSDSSMGYTRSSSMDSPLASSPCHHHKDSAVPFSPIQAHLDAKGHPQLKPRPFYR